MRKFVREAGLVIIGLVLLFPWHALSGPTVEIHSLNQIRENSVGDQELPWLNQFHLAIPVSELQGQFTVYGQVFADPLLSTSAADLFQASFKWAHQPWGMKAQVGRFLLSKSEAVVPIDGGEFSVATTKWATLRVFGGMRRHLEVSNFEDESALVGMDVRVHPWSITSLRIGYHFEDDLDSVDRQWLVAAFRQAIPVHWTPTLYATIDFQTDEEIVSNGKVGVEVHPLDNLQVSGEMARYDEANDGFEWQDRIYTLFARGAEWQGSGAVAVQFTEKVSLHGSYGFQSFDVLINETRHGHLVNVGGRWISGRRPWILRADGFYHDSFGGRAVGFSGHVDKQITQGIWARGAFAVAGYEKVTGSDDYALHTGLGVSYRLPWGLELGIDGEFNSNIDQTRDLRVGVMAKYVYF